MVKELQRKFIKTTMLVVTILLIVFLAVMNIVNLVLSRRDSLSTLNRIVVRDESQIPGVAGTPGGGYVDDPMLKKDPAAEEGNLGIYFVARVNEEGAILFSDLTHAGDLSWDAMVALLQSINEFDVEVTGETEVEMFAEGSSSGALEVPPAIPENGTHAPGGDIPPEKPEGEQHEPDSEEREQPGKKKSITGRTGSYLYRATRQDDGSVIYAFLNVSQETQSMIRILLVTVVVGIGAWILVFLLVINLSKRAIAPIAENIEKQRQFITDAGHELKTPLAVIISNVDVQELHGGKTKWLDNIRLQALRLSDLTKQMLTLSKMDESGTNSFITTTFDASQIMQDTIRIFRESASLRGMRIHPEIDSGIQITFSREQYQQMLELLMDNAVKYGKEDGEILISLHANRKSVWMTFSNPCEELPDIEPDRLFDRFYRADTSRSRHTGGSGIGLAVVRAIAEHNGGKANAYFRPDNVIEFVIELPRN